MEYIRIKNGLELPAIGFGPGICGYTSKYNEMVHGWQSIPKRAYRKFVKRPHQEKEYVHAIATAICMGYSLIDYSASYGDGSLICKGIYQSSVARENLKLTTRISNHAQFQGKEAVRQEFFEQLRGLGTDYIDLLMFHWPVTGCYESTWQTMVELYREGYVRTLGVANCHVHHLENLFMLTEEKPLVNQFEIHPLFSQKELIAYCKNKGIQPEAYTPIARFDDRLIKLPLLHRIAINHKKSVLQVILRWHIQNHVIPVIRTLNSKHQHENMNVFDFVLTDEEMKSLDGVNINARVRYDPDNCDFSIL